MALDIDSLADDTRISQTALFDRLDEVDGGGTLSLETDGVLDDLLALYAIERGVRLSWSYEETESGRTAVVEKDAGREEELFAFDVRDLPPQQRHELLLSTFDALDPGAGFILVNDHDPKPLSHELRSTRGETFDWEYRSRGDGEWRVAIEKNAESTAVETDVMTRFDLRELEDDSGYESVHHRFRVLPTGETMELLAAVEPRDLREQFREQYGATVSWDVVAIEDEHCCVHVTRVEAGGEDGLTIEHELDVRDRPPAQRHEAIFAAYDELEPGNGFMLVNDHDPKPLYHQFQSEADDRFRWAYRQRAPGEFRVLIGKAATEKDGGSVTSEATETEQYDAVCDVRDIDGEPFGDIMAALDQLGADETLLLINSFEPVPLYDVLSQRGFTHETRQVDSETYHVEITDAS